MKILVAEDQVVAAMHLRRNLEIMGHDVTVAPDGEAAWARIRDGSGSVAWNARYSASAV